MQRVLAAALLALCCAAPRAAVLSYEWTIDWASGPDATGALTFDDLSDATPRGYVWGRDALPLPSIITFTPPGFGASGSLSFDGASVLEVQGCDDALTFCSGPALAAGGYTSVVFTLSGAGRSERATLRPDASAPCDADGAATLDRACFAFDAGTTTFAAVTPTTPIPEPGTLALLLAGLVGIGFVTRRRRHD